MALELDAFKLKIAFDTARNNVSCARRSSTDAWSGTRVKLGAWGLEWDTSGTKTYKTSDLKHARKYISLARPLSFSFSLSFSLSLFLSLSLSPLIWGTCKVPVTRAGYAT